MNKIDYSANKKLTTRLNRINFTYSLRKATCPHRRCRFFYCISYHISSNKQYPHRLYSINAITETTPMQRKKNHHSPHFFSFSSFIPILFRNFASAFCKECKDILLTFRYELPPRNRIDRARLLSKECTHSSVDSPLDNRGCGRPVAEMAVCAVSVTQNLVLTSSFEKIVIT